MCGKNWALPLLLFSLALPLWSESSPAGAPTFHEKLDQALNPLRKLPEPQKTQLGLVLTIFADEFDLRATASGVTEKKLADLQTSFSQVVEAHQKEMAEIRAEALRNDLMIGAGGVTVGVLAGVILTLILTK